MRRRQIAAKKAISEGNKFLNDMSAKEFSAKKKEPEKVAAVPVKKKRAYKKRKKSQ